MSVITSSAEAPAPVARTSRRTAGGRRCSRTGFGPVRTWAESDAAPWVGSIPPNAPRRRVFSSARRDPRHPRRRTPPNAASGRATGNPLCWLRNAATLSTHSLALAARRCVRGSLKRPTFAAQRWMAMRKARRKSATCSSSATSTIGRALGSMTFLTALSVGTGVGQSRLSPSWVQNRFSSENTPVAIKTSITGFGSGHRAAQRKHPPHSGADRDLAARG